MINVDDVGIINVVSNVNKSQCQAQILTDGYYLSSRFL